MILSFFSYKENTSYSIYILIFKQFNLKKAQVMKKMIILFSVLILAVSISAQETAPPVDDAQVLSNIEWLNSTPMKNNETEWLQHGLVLIKWAGETDKVTLSLDNAICDYFNLDSSLFIAYVAGWAKYSLQNNYSNDAVKCTTAGITNSVAHYKKNKKIIGKSETLDNYADMIKKGALEGYIANSLNK